MRAPRTSSAVALATSTRAFALVSLSTLTLLACGQKGDAAEGAGGGAGAGAMKMPVEAVTLAEEPVRDESEYLAQLVSRHQVAIYPQVSANISAILVKPGQMVKQGDALIQIDPRREAANLSNDVAGKAQREANLALAKRNEQRSASLLREGLVSRQQFEQDQSERQVAEAALAAQEAAITAQSTQVSYYRITAPFDGRVGDIPIKLGDFVTPQTKLTSLDDNSKLEAYVYIPAENLGKLNDASRIDIVGDDAALIAESPVTFIAEEANPQTQSVLIKGTFPNDGKLRAAQLVRARVVWKTHPGVYVPTVAATRQSGQYFVFVNNGGAAHQVPITVGDIEDSRFAIVSGLKAGDQVITTQVQKLHDGAPVAVTPAKPTAPAGDGGAAAPASSGSSAPAASSAP